MTEIETLRAHLMEAHNALHANDVTGAHNALHAALKGEVAGDVADRLTLTRTFDEGFRFLAEEYPGGMFVYVAVVRTGAGPRAGVVTASIQTGGHGNLCRIVDETLLAGGFARRLGAVR